MYQALIFSSAAVLSALVLLLCRKNKSHCNIVLKVLAVVFCTVGFVRFFLSDSIVYLINGGWFENVFYDRQDPLNVALRWGYYINYAILPVAVFCKTRFFKNVACYVALPFSILSAVFFDDFMKYFLSPEGRGFHGDPLFRHIFFAVELALAIMIPIIFMISEKHVFKVGSFKEWRNFILGLPAVFLVMTPAYLPNTIIAQNSLTPSMFSDYHFVWIGVTAVLAIVVYYLFRFCNYEDRYTICLFLAIALFFHYNSLYLMGLTIKRLPFQLCNIAAYFYLLGVVFKWEKFMQFCFIANIVGTLFAIIAPDFSVGQTSFWNTHFLWEHTLVFIIPIACMGLRIIPKITWKSWKYYFIGFTSYIVFAYVSGTILNGYSDVTGETVNYFYMFNFETAFEYFPFLQFVEDYKIELGRFVMYPLVPLIVYVGFSALCFLLFLATRLIYKIEDDCLELRRSAIDLWEKITKKPCSIPKDFID